MNLIVPAIGLASLGSVGLAYVRLASNGTEGSRALDIAALLAAFCTSIAVVLAAIGTILATMPEDGWFDDTTLMGVAGTGAISGLVMVVCVRVLMLEVWNHLWHWSRRLPRETERSLAEFLTTTLALMAGAAVVFALFFVGIHAVAPYGKLAWLVMPALLALMPMYETFIHPWIQYARAPTLSAERLEGLEAWIEKVRADRGFPRLRVRIQNGALPNAFAIGGLGAHLIVVGKGLVEQLSAPQLQAVIAHEIAHVARKDVPRLLPPIVTATTLYAAVIVNVSTPLFQTHQVWGYVGGALVSGVSFAALVMLIPGFFMRRMEFGADRVAAEMLGDGEVLAQALERLAEISGQPLDKWSWSHPPLQARIAALRSSAG